MGSLLISWWRPSSYKICWYSLGNIMQAHSKRDTWSTTKRNCKQLTPINIRIIRVQIQAKILFTEALTSNETLWQLLSPENTRNYSNLLGKLAAAPDPYQRQQVPLSDVHEARLFNQTDVGGQIKQSHHLSREHHGKLQSTNPPNARGDSSSISIGCIRMGLYGLNFAVTVEVVPAGWPLWGWVQDQAL